ncbi:MAG TPA: hypothetical protein VM056_01790 [Terriglobales bacterium]|nr:hypothetical protein [Terriglobales bacterium]
MKPTQHRRPGNHKERGYVLIAILFILAVMIIALTAAAPAIATSVKRQREEELIRRGKQYQRAIQLYYRKFGRFPASVDQLENTNNVRFLRRKYSDPITGKDEWRLIRFGQAKPKTPPAYLTGGVGGGQQPGAAGGVMPGTSASSMSRPLSGSSSIGGGPIVGVASMSEKESLKEMDGKNHYHEWEFTYDPSLDANARQQQQPGGGSTLPRRNPQGPGPTPQTPPTPQR